MLHRPGHRVEYSVRHSTVRFEEVVWHVPFHGRIVFSMPTGPLVELDGDEQAIRPRTLVFAGWSVALGEEMICRNRLRVGCGSIRPGLRLYYLLAWGQTNSTFPKIRKAHYTRSKVYSATAGAIASCRYWVTEVTEYSVEDRTSSRTTAALMGNENSFGTRLGEILKKSCLNPCSCSLYMQLSSASADRRAPDSRTHTTRSWLDLVPPRHLLS